MIHTAPTLSTSTLSQMKIARRTPTCFLLGRMSFFHHISISVVEALAEAGAIDALEAAAHFRSSLPLFGRHRHPDLVATLEVREAVVSDVVAHVPERERRERRQERDAADDLVEPVVLACSCRGRRRGR